MRRHSFIFSLTLSFPSFLSTACSTGSSGTGAPALVDAGLAEAGGSDDAGADGEPAGGEDAASAPDAYDAALMAAVAEGGGPDASAPDGGALDASFDAAECGAPSGTYTTTCTGCLVNGGMLTCDCETGSATSSPTTLDLCACPNTATISNANGILTCCGNPGGTYAQSCDHCAITDTVLGCTCKTDNGGYISSFLPLCACQPPSLISNTNGILTCQ